MTMDSDTTFVCLEAVWNSKVFDGDFAKMTEKICMFNEKFLL